MSVAEDNDERFDDDDESLTGPVIMAQLILTNKVMENLLDDVTSRIEMIRKVADVALEHISENGHMTTEEAENSLRSILRITNRKPDLTFLEGFSEFTSDDDDE